MAVRFSPVRAAFEGFRLLGREPFVLIGWTAVFMADLLCSVAASIGLRGALAGVLSTQLRTLTGSLAAIAIEAVTFGVLGTAAYRGVLRPSDHGLWRVKLGRDEIRLLVLWLLKFPVLVTGLIAAISLLVLIPDVRGVLFPGYGFPSSPLVVAVVGVLTVLTLVLAVWIDVRLSLVGATSFAAGRLRLRAPWLLTKDRFWGLVGCYLLLLVFTAVFELLDIALRTAANATIRGSSFSDALQQAFRPTETTSLSVYFTLPGFAYLVIGSLIRAAASAVQFAPGAAVYRDLQHDTPQGRAEVFD